MLAVTSRYQFKRGMVREGDLMYKGLVLGLDGGPVQAGLCGGDSAIAPRRAPEDRLQCPASPQTRAMLYLVRGFEGCLLCPAIHW